MMGGSGARECFGPDIMSRGAGLTLAVIAACKKENAYVPPPPQPVDVAKPVQQAVTPYLEVTGNAVADNQVDLEARVQGFLQEINYQDGAAVKQADTLFVIEPAPYQAQLQQAQADAGRDPGALVQAQAEFNASPPWASRTSPRSRRSTRRAPSATATRRDCRTIRRAYDRRDQPRLHAGHRAVRRRGHRAPGVGRRSGRRHAARPSWRRIVQLDPIYVTFTVSEQEVLRVKAAMAKRGLTAERRQECPGRDRADDGGGLSARRQARLRRADDRPIHRHADAPAAYCTTPTARCCPASSCGSACRWRLETGERPAGAR